MENRRINKRPRSITEFRSSYSDNKKNTGSTDKTSKRQLVLKIIFAAIILAGVALAGFLVTDALLTISEEPYVGDEKVTVEHTDIDPKYFENQVTIPADKIPESDNNSDLRE